MLSSCEIERFYLDYPLQLKGIWNLSRKHFRVSLGDGRFVKLNRFENRLTVRDLKFYCWKLKPLHVYFSVLNWLFPERVGKKLRARGYSPTLRITSLNKIVKLIEGNSKTEDAIGKIEMPDSKTAMSSLTTKLDSPQLYSVYAGRLAKYLLLRIDKDFWELENFPGYPGSVTVEHILPQTPPVGSQWTKDFNEADRKEWTNKLGNLVLLSGRKNSQAQNYDFDKKKKVYFTVKGTAFKITQELKSLLQWNMETLRARHKQLYEMATKIYSI